MERKIELDRVFRERKDVLCCLQEKLKKMLGFTEGFIQGCDNFKISGLSDHEKSKMRVQTINKCKYIKSIKRGEHYHPIL